MRRRCLAEGLETRTFTYEAPWKHRIQPTIAQIRGEIYPETESYGVWGGTLYEDRHALRHLPRPEAFDELERTRSTRIEARIAAWRTTLGKRPNDRPYPSKQDEAIAELLDERPMLHVMSDA